MTEDIISGNKLIAEFMEFDVEGNTQWIINEDAPRPRHIEVAGTVDDLQYHSSWDCLIPAIKKWDNLKKIGTGKAGHYAALCDSLDDAVTRRYEIIEAWEQLVRNIKWYNQ